MRQIRREILDDDEGLCVGPDLHEALAVLGNVGQADRLFVQIVAARLDAREIENFVDDAKQVVAARVDIAGVFPVGLAADRTEQLLFHDLREAHDGIERSSELMAHRCEKARFCFVGGFRAPACLIRNRARFLELRDEIVFFGAVLDHGERGGMQATGQIDEEDVDADGHRSEREIEGIAEREEPACDRNRHRNGAGEEDLRQRRCKCHADREHDHQRRENEDMRRERCRRSMRCRVHRNADQSEGGKREPIAEFDPDEMPAPLADVDVGAGHRKQSAALIEHVDAGDRDDRDPHGRLDEGRPEHRRDVEDEAQRGHGERRARLVAREHRQQFVFEFGLVRRAVGQPFAKGFELVIGTAPPRRP